MNTTAAPAPRSSSAADSLEALALDPAALFARMERDDRWGGFGYLGERRNWLDESDPGRPALTAEVADVDEAVLELVVDAGWSYEDLFGWANSKDGRWFADTAYGCKDLRGAMRYLRRQGA